MQKIPFCSKWVTYFPILAWKGLLWSILERQVLSECSLHRQTTLTGDAHWPAVWTVKRTEFMHQMPSFAEGWKCALENSDLKKKKKKKKTNKTTCFIICLLAPWVRPCVIQWEPEWEQTLEPIRNANELMKVKKPAKVGQIVYGYNLTSPDPFWPETRIFNF